MNAPINIDTNALKSIPRGILTAAKESFGYLTGLREDIKTARAEARDITGRNDVPKEAPDDLKNEHGWMLQTSSGYAVSGRLTPLEAVTGSESPARRFAQWMVVPLIVALSVLGFITPAALSPLAMLITAVVAVAYAWLVKGGGGVAGAIAIVLAGASGLGAVLTIPAIVLSSGTAVALAILALGIFASLSTGRFIFAFFASLIGCLLLFSPFPIPILGHGLAGSPAVHLPAASLGLNAPLLLSLLAIAAMSISESRRRTARVYALVSEADQGTFALETPQSVKARRMQAERSLKDKSPVIEIGTATGDFLRRGDVFAPDPGQRVYLSADDLSTHLLVIGSTGSGKTSSTFRPIINIWLRAKAGGLLVLDGKGLLPAEFKDVSGYQLITPGVPLGLIEGLNAEAVIDSIAGIMATGMTGESAQWRQYAERTGRAGAVVLEAAHEIDPKTFKWTLMSILNIVTNPQFRRQALLAVADGLDKGIIESTTLLDDATRYWAQEWPSLGDRFQGSVLGIFSGWVSTITAHRDLLPWAVAETGIDPTSVLRGAAIGIDVPAVKYGTAASAAVQALVRRRIYDAALRRGDHWPEGDTGVLVCMDEAQEILNAADLNIAPMARSIGIRLLAGTQSVEQVAQRLGGADAAASFLNQFRSLLLLSASPKSVEFAAERAGAGRQLQSQTLQSPPNFGAVPLARIAKSPANDPTHPDFKKLRWLEAHAFHLRHHEGSLLASWRGANRMSFGGFLSLMNPFALLAGAANKAPVNYPDFAANNPQAAQAAYGNLQGLDRLGLSEEPGPWAPPHLVQAMTDTPFVALALLLRAGAPRRDFIELHPQFTTGASKAPEPDEKLEPVKTEVQVTSVEAKTAAEAEPKVKSAEGISQTDAQQKATVISPVPDNPNPTPEPRHEDELKLEVSAAEPAAAQPTPERRCPNGHPLTRPGAKFCGRCGAKVTA
jgi:hypothetical protein